MPDFYQNLKLQFERVRQAQIMLDYCMDNLTDLMEQAAHMFTEVADVPPVEAEEGPAVPEDEPIGFASPWPMPASSLPTDENGEFVVSPPSVSYEGNVCQPTIGTVKYE
jgi:hypothetical protein